MNIKYTVVFCALLFLLNQNSVAAPQPVELSKEDIISTFSGKTVSGYDHQKGLAFVRYYDKNGKLYTLSTRKGENEGKWSVVGAELCEDFGVNRCYKLEKVKKIIKKYDKYGKKVETIEYFTDGNQLN